MLNFIRRLFRRNIVNTPPTPPPATPTGTRGTSATRGQKVEQVAFDNAIAIINLRLDNSNLIMTVVVIALTICFLTLFFGYWQFAGTSYNDYRDQVKQLNDDRYELQQQKYDFLDSQIKAATQSAL